MRRSERELRSDGEKLAVIEACKVCRLALVSDGRPYVVPLNYGYAFEAGRLTLYFHGAREGKKVEAMRASPLACFEVDCDGALVEGPAPCAYGFAYRSVIGEGRVEFAATEAEAVRALSAVMRHQTGKPPPYAFAPEHLRHTLAYALRVERFTGKAAFQQR